MSFTREQVREAWLRAWVLAHKPDDDDTYRQYARLMMSPTWPSDEEELTQLFRAAFVADPNQREAML